MNELVPFHIGIMVPEIDAAITSFADAFGLEFCPPVELEGELEYVDVARPWHVHLTCSRGGTFRYELIEPIDRRGWATIPGGPFVHHVGNWVEDLELAHERLSRAGFSRILAPVDHAQWGYYRSPFSGPVIEVCERSVMQPILEEWFGQL